MSAYRTVETQLFQPDSRAVDSAPAQGEWVNPEAVQVAEARGILRQLPAILAESVIGQSTDQIHRWRGALPEGMTPGPGWEMTIDGARFRVLSAMRSMGRTWKLDCVAAG